MQTLKWLGIVAINTVWVLVGLVWDMLTNKKEKPNGKSEKFTD